MQHFIRTSLLLAATLALALPLEAASSRILFNGGITLDERETAPENGTKLEFVVSSGSFLSAVKVRVTDNSGNEVVSTVTQGPWLILDLAPGSYNVLATRQNGAVQGGPIQVSGTPEKFAFMFPEN